MRRQAALIGVIFFIFVFLAPVRGAEYKYHSGGGRDPFIPLVTGEAKVSLGLRAVEDIGDVRLEGIIFDPNGESIAVLNDEILKEGDKAYNVEVLKIDRNSVIIKIHDKTRTINLIKEGGEKI